MQIKWWSFVHQELVEFMGGGGYNYLLYYNTHEIDFVTISSTGNATDFGDLTQKNMVWV